MAAPQSAQPDLEALLTRSVGALVGDDASLRFGVAVSGGPDSMALLAEVVAELSAADWRVVNVDCNVICESPKIAPRRDEIMATMSRVVGAPVNVKGRRAEEMGAIGRGEGVMCLAVALVSRGA